MCTSTPADLPFQICTAANASPRTLGGTNTYLLGRSETIVIDPGPDDASHRARVLSRGDGPGRRIVLILLTHGHRDHSGSADALAQATGAPIRGLRTASPVEDGMCIAVGTITLRAIYTPGHAGDHLAFHWEDEGILFCGDLMSGAGTINVTPPGGSMTAYLRSLERVARLKLSLIAPGHGPLVRAPRERIEEYIVHRRRREEQILGLLATGPQTVPTLTDAIYPTLDSALRSAAEGTVTAHLEKLVDEHRVRQEGGRYRLRGGEEEGGQR